MADRAHTGRTALPRAREQQRRADRRDRSRGPHRLREPEPRGGRRRPARLARRGASRTIGAPSLASFAQALRAGEPSRISFRVHNLTGETALGRVDADAVPAEDGERHVLIVSRDVTEARQIERAAAREPRALPADRRERLRHDRRVRQRRGACNTPTTGCAQVLGFGEESSTTSSTPVPIRPSRRPRARSCVVLAA